MKNTSNISANPEITQSAESSTPERRTRVQGSFGEITPFTLMSSGASKILRGCNVLQVPNQIMPLWVPIRESRCDGSKLMAYLRIILRDESQTISNILLNYFGPKFNQTNQPTQAKKWKITYSDIRVEKLCEMIYEKNVKYNMRRQA